MFSGWKREKQGARNRKKYIYIKKMTLDELKTYGMRRNGK